MERGSFRTCRVSRSALPLRERPTRPPFTRRPGRVGAGPPSSEVLDRVQWKHGQRVSSPQHQPHTHALATGRSSSSKPSAAASVTIAASFMPRSLALRYDSNSSPVSGGGRAGRRCAVTLTGGSRVQQVRPIAHSAGANRCGYEGALRCFASPEDSFASPVDTPWREGHTAFLSTGPYNFEFAPGE
jgi:hypothetical protein